MDDQAVTREGMTCIAAGLWPGCDITAIAGAGAVMVVVLLCIALVCTIRSHGRDK